MIPTLVILTILASRRGLDKGRLGGRGLDLLGGFVLTALVLATPVVIGGRRRVDGVISDAGQSLAEKRVGGQQRALLYDHLDSLRRQI